MFMVQKGGAIQIHNDERKDKQADWSLQFDNKNVMNLLKGVYDSLNQNSQSNWSNFSKFGQGNLINKTSFKYWNKFKYFYSLAKS